MSNLHPTMAQVVALTFPGMYPSAEPLSPRTHTSALIASIDGWHPDHCEIIDVLTAMQRSINYSSNSLGSQCRSFVADMLNEAIGDVERERLEQIDEQAWRDGKRAAA